VAKTRVSLCRPDTYIGGNTCSEALLLRNSVYKTYPRGPAQKERTLPTKTSEARSTDVRARAEANFKKEERAKEGAKAMLEYQTNSRVVREKMSRLKALRLAKEAADKEAVAAAVPAAKVKAVPGVKAKAAKR
jgi:hypothetical protein